MRVADAEDELRDLWHELLGSLKDEPVLIVVAIALACVLLTTLALVVIEAVSLG